MTETRVVAKTYDEAVTNALIQLQTTSDNVDIEILEEGKEGLFGVIGSRPWMIKVSLKLQEQKEEEAVKTVPEVKKQKEKTEEKKAEKKPESKGYEAVNVLRVNEDTVREQPAANKETAPVKVSAEKAEKPVKNKKPVQGEKKKNTKPKTEKPAKDTEIKAEVKKEAVKNEPAEKKELKPISEEEVILFTERGEKFLKDIFSVMNMDVQLTSSFNHEENELGFVLSGDDMGILIGKRGQTLDSLQYLVSLVVNKHHDGYIRVKLDTENYRERRQEKLEELAHNIANKVRKTRHSIELEPMNPYERRIIHSALQNDPYVTTISEGEDPYRHVVVILKKSGRKNNRRRGPRPQEEAPVQAADNSEEN